MLNKFASTKLEFHIIQSFPVSCLNRDDVGSPKSAIIGGVERARVSSQCWKRAIRMAMHNMNVPVAERTKLIVSKIANACVAQGADPEVAKECGKKGAGLLTKSVKDGVSDTLFFISNSEANAVAKFFADADFDANKINDKDFLKVFKNAFDPAHDGIDIALFGRMVANAPELNVEAAVSVAHAISTHKVASEIDFFTAVDDVNHSESGAAHMGTLEYNSATYYRYVSVDLGQLAESVKTENIDESVAAFMKALFVAYPSARQTTMAAACPWNYAIVALRKGQGIQIPFNKPVKNSYDSNMVDESIKALNANFNNVERMYGSLFGLKAKFEISETKGSIDSLIADVLSEIDKI